MRTYFEPQRYEWFEFVSSDKLMMVSIFIRPKSSSQVFPGSIFIYTGGLCHFNNRQVSPYLKEVATYLEQFTMVKWIRSLPLSSSPEFA